MKPERPKRRMLLIASVGVATVSYVLGCEKQPAGNLAAPAPTATATSPVAGNLMPAPPQDAGESAPIAVPPSAVPPIPTLTPEQLDPTGGNLMAPRPPQPPPSGSTPVKKPPPPPLTPGRPTPPTGGNLMAPRPAAPKQ